MDKVIWIKGYISKSLGDRTLEAVVSTGVKDRHGTRVNPEGWLLKNFKKNPVLLWAHQYDQPPIGKILNIRVVNGEMRVKIQFADTDFAREIYRLYEDGVLNAFSVGFIVLEWGDPKKDKYEIMKQELLEISAVPVPANPEALVVGKNITADMLKKMNEDKEKLEDLKKKYVVYITANTEVRGAVPFKSTPLADEGYEWDKTKAIQRLRKWASSDGSGDKDKIDWTKYRQAFAWYDPEKADSFAGYKLPHHDIVDGKLKTVWRGVSAAMASLFGARGGVKIPDADRKKVYNHLAKHYKEFDKDVPEFKEYSDVELRMVFEGMSELDIVLERFAILESKIDSLVEQLAKAPESSKQSPTPNNKAEGGKPEKVIVIDLEGIKKIRRSLQLVDKAVENSLHELKTIHK